MKRYNTGLISANRNTVYGLSILWLMFFHSGFSFARHWMFPLAAIKRIGNCGVDIFLFVSGISLFFSMTKGGAVKDFYLRRLRRIILPTLIIVIPWYAFLAPSRPSSVLGYLMDITTLSLFTTGKRAFWFITAILCFYAVYPLFYHAFEKTNHSRCLFLALIGASVLVNAVIRHLAPSFWSNSEILFRRFPIFIIGAYCGKYVYEKRTLSVKHIHIVLISAFLLLVSFMLHKPLSKTILVRYSYIPMAISFTAFFSILGNVPPINRVASWLAPITLEIYLCHEKWLSIIARALPSAGKFSVNVIALLLTIVSALILQLIEKRVFRGERKPSA